MSDVQTESKDGVLEIRFDRPKKKNALTVAMYAAMVEALERAAKDPAIRAVAFTAEGETFTAGNDVIDFMNGLGDGEPPVLRFIRLLATFEKPLVAAVNGAAVGLGTTMLLHCDLVYASEAARLHAPFVSLGLVPEAASSLLLPQRVGTAVAAEMLLLGTPMSATRAKELGLINEIVPAGELRAIALARAVALAKQPPQALRRARALLRGDVSATLARLDDEARLFAECLGGAEAREAFTAFIEKRAPDFSKLA
jgi:enoyl-CoA hydratase/carnithine racemase